MAALCCARLLGEAGIRVVRAPAPRPAVPALLLGRSGLGLIRGLLGRSDLFADLPQVRRRVVAWNGAPAGHPHAGVVVSEAALLEALGEGLPTSAGEAADFTVRTDPPARGEQRRFGTRTGAAIAVRVRDPADAETCWIEAVESGWLFLLAAASGEAWLLGVGATVDALLAASRLIAPRIERRDGASARFDTCPRIADPASGDGWCASGTAAIAFDPICGDGVAQAVRGAILASAAIAGMARGGDPRALTHHYATMLAATMRRHLALCADFYRTGGTGAWWQAEHAALRAGHDWCTARLATAPPPAFRLVGDRLVKQAAA